MNKRLKIAVTAGLASCALFSSAVYATNGYFLIGYGAKSRAMGGVGVAKGLDGLAAAYNPATMADVSVTGDTGTRLDISGELFKPNAAVYHDKNNILTPTPVDEQPDSPSTAFSQNGYYMLPALGWVTRINKDLTWGFAMVGAGAAAEYNQQPPAGDGSYFFNFNGLGGDYLNIKLMQLQMLPSLAYRLDEHNTVGVSIVAAFQLFEANGLGAFDQLGFGAAHDHLSNQGIDTSFGGGLRLGWKGKYLDETLHVGVNYSSRTYMQRFRKYENLFAEHGDFDIPENYAIGIAYEFTPDITTYFDIQRINFGDIASVGNKGPKITGDFFPCGDISCGALGLDQGLGFGWKNITVYKLGIEYRYSEKIILRGGLNHGDAAIPKDQVLFSMLAPATVKDHVTLGASYNWSKDIEISGSYVHAFKNTITGPTAFQPPGADPLNPSDNASLAMEQNSVGVTVGIKF